MKARYALIALVWAGSLVGIGVWAQGSAETQADRRVAGSLSEPRVTTQPPGLEPGEFRAVAQQPQMLRPGDAVGPVIAGGDIGFRPVYDPHTPAGAVTGRWMVRVNGEWLEAATPVRAMPAR
jgi:hypothetical protein